VTTPDSTTDPANSDGAANSDHSTTGSSLGPMSRHTSDGAAWSARLADRFAIDFGDDLNHWWDELCCHSPRHDSRAEDVCPGEFCYPATPQTLLSTVPDPIWPPLMPPNFLPLVGNGAGDWLCVRLLDPDVATQTGIQTDICQWYHGGGDWLPWGDRLSEALLFDWLLPKLPQSQRRHAEPAIENAAHSDSGPSETPWREHPWGQWVTAQLPVITTLDVNDPQRLAAGLLSAGICEIPVRCQLTIDALASQIGGLVGPQIAQDLGIAWNDLMRWCFDLRTMPSEVSQRLQTALNLPASALDPAQQNWNDVASHAAAVNHIRSDLSWSHDLSGYVRWSMGDVDAAAHAFSSGLRCSVFTDQSVRMRTHWATSADGFAKFSAKFLDDIPETPASIQESSEQLGRLPSLISDDRLLEYFGRGSLQGSDSVRQRYCQMLVAESATSSSPATSARLLYAAGWDLGAEPLRRFGELLDQYIIACRDAGWTSHERLASIHRDGLKARYNL
jgi:hypothetical protein